MARTLPTNAAQMRSLLAQFLDQSKGTMASEKDNEWLQAEIERYSGQTSMLKSGIKRSRKTTGIVRKVDELGRLVIPKETRDAYGFDQGQALEIFVDTETNMIVLQKYEPGCNLCGESPTEELTMFHGKRICENCLNELFNMV